MVEFRASAAEISAGSLSPETLDAVDETIEREGYVVVGGLIDPEICERLVAPILEDVKAVRARPEPTLHEVFTGNGHLQLGLRRSAPHVQAQVVANPLIESVIGRVLGSDAWLGFYNGNVNCPGSAYQPVHFDRPFPWKTEAEAAAAGQAWPPRTITLSCSVALTDITEHVGATEVFPRTHRETVVIGWPRGERVQDHPELVEQWSPPSKMTIPAGGVCFRDPRMWHRGVPNPGSAPRPLIAITYHAALAQHFRGLIVTDLGEGDRRRCAEDSSLKVLDSGELGDGRLVFDESAREAFESEPSKHGVNRNARFVAEPFHVNHFLNAHDVGGAGVVEGEAITPYPDE